MVLVQDGSEQYVLEFYSQTLLSKPCQNQGLVLDGFPKTFEQAKTSLKVCLTVSPLYTVLSPPFTVGEEEEEGEENTDDDQPKYNKLTMPGTHRHPIHCASLTP